MIYKAIPFNTDFVKVLHIVMLKNTQFVVFGAAAETKSLGELTKHPAPMQKRMKLICIFSLLFISLGTQAQLGGLLKKKKKEEKAAVADTVAPVTEPVEKEEKKKKGGLFQKVVGKFAKAAGNAVASGSGLVNTINNLADADVIVSTGTNIYSKDLGLVLTDLVGKEWISNGDFTMLQLASKDAYQMHKYSGVIKVNGTELKHFSMGIHAATEKPGSGNKKISFEQNGVVEGGFEVPVPAKNIKLVSINGQNKNVQVDFTKDVVLELANYSTGPGALVRIDVVGTIIGIRSLYLVAYVKPAAKVTIPAAAFRNIETTNKGVNFNNGYLAVSDQQKVKALNTSGVIPATQMVITGSNDGMWVNVTNSEKNSNGFTLKTGNAVVEKGNAAYAQPLSRARKTAVSTFFTYGTTYLYDVENNRWNQSQTTKTIDFPEIPDSYLDGMLSNLYQQLTATFSDVTGSTVLPATTIPALPAYENTKKFFPGEVNNDGEFLKVYKNLDPTRTLTSVSNTNYGDNALLNEAGADALLKVSLVCQLSWDKKPAITPYLKVELVGESNGGFRSFAGNTKYFTMNIKGEPYELKKKQTVVFDEVFQVNRFNESFKQALQELKKKEAETGDYETIWRIQQ